MDSLDTYADRLEPEVSQFEANGGLWRLESDRHAFRLRENQAMGAENAEARAAATVTLAGIVFEIDRLQAFARDHSGMPDSIILRLAEAGLALEMARRRLMRALDS